MALSAQGLTYYKATRPDGFSFADPTFGPWEVGKTLRRPKDTGSGTSNPARIKINGVTTNPPLCGPGWLHASNEPGEVLVGGKWPCRLFRVEGKAHIGFDSRHPHKGGFLQLKVVEELPAHLALGPNGEEVAALIERARKLTAEEAKRLAAAGDAAWDAARAAAWDAARAAAGDAAGAAARAAAWAAARAAAGDAAWDAAGAAAWAAAGDAAWALVVKDLITPEQFDALYAPWREVVEEARA